MNDSQKKNLLAFVAIAGIVLVGVLYETRGNASDSAGPKVESAISSLKMQIASIALPVEYPNNNLYLSVSNFNPRNASQVRELCEQVREHGSKLKWPSTVHVLDNEPGFKPPAEGMYGSEAIQNKVVIQVVFMANGRQFVAWDPFGQGRYEPDGDTEQYFQ